MTFTLTPIGHVRGGRTDAIDDDWGASRATIALDAANFTPDALAGLADFSHAEVIFLFDKVPDEKIETGARHPRNRADWPLVGIFAQRGKNRPNRIGLTTCRIVAVDGLSVEVEGLDAIDGTPVLDIKPVMVEFLPRGDVRQPDWSHELMQGYWVKP
ncbi:SAM-dependent methyltransferase [Sphingopyxis sp. BSN-002]|uniref:SAM-dependent methyltransferase n=1 Tax=Sphingopyxis sp. BSN-002 TaxID=2911495 RepID=UPI001EDA594A|nr:SAM-dependent methyltransferase [Sphingopyxis sp. BSN-002]UKK83585.1 SAM-dependent methyltransferase [Sphingopyxis sp. BSN-002]